MMAHLLIYLSAFTGPGGVVLVVFVISLFKYNIITSRTLLSRCKRSL